MSRAELRLPIGSDARIRLRDALSELVLQMQAMVIVCAEDVPIEGELVERLCLAVGAALEEAWNAPSNLDVLDLRRSREELALVEELCCFAHVAEWSTEDERRTFEAGFLEQVSDVIPFFA